jgi:kynurenine formamidase
VDDASKINWGRWGTEDEVGALNLVDSKKVLEALTLVKEGRVISLAQPIGPRAGVPPHRNRNSRFMDRDAGDYALGARSPDGFRFAEDTVQMSTHSGTHVDALAHVWTGDTLYNGHSSANTRSTGGAQKLGADKLRPTLTRGILVDLVAASGGPLAPSTPVNSADLIRSYARSGIIAEPGDAVLLRTGWWESMGTGNDYFDREPGVSDDGARWLADQDVALVGADNYAVEVQPDPGGKSFPVHIRLLHGQGIPLIENLDLRELSTTGVSSFLFVFSPIGLQGSTGSPVNPIAVL